MKNDVKKVRLNQTEWMIKVWDVGTKGFSDYWPVSTWSQSRRAGLDAARQCLAFNRGADKIPRFTVRHMADRSLIGLNVMA
jgi:hypothetical protein